MRGSLTRYRLRNMLVAGAFAILGALLVFIYVSSYRNDVEKGAGLVEVYVAARDIPEGTDGATATGGGYLEKQTVLERNVVGGAISSPTQISRLVASQMILAGQQISVRAFHSADEQGVLANISGNRRAMRIPGDSEQLLSGIVKDGDHIDVVANIDYVVRQGGSDTRGDLPRVAARMILRDVLVLRAPSGDSDGSTDASTTLALSDSQAQKLFFAMNNGDWWLVLRPVSRPADSPESVVTIESLLADGLGITGIAQLRGGAGAGSIGSGN